MRFGVRGALLTGAFLLSLPASAGVSSQTRPTPTPKPAVLGKGALSGLYVTLKAKGGFDFGASKEHPEIEKVLRNAADGVTETAVTSPKPMSDATAGIYRKILERVVPKK